MFRKSWLFILVCLLFISLFMSGCGKEDQVQQESSNSVSSSAGDEVTAILAKCSEVKEIYFKYIVLNDETIDAEGKAWVKGNKSRNEISVDGQTIISIYDLDKEESCVYFVGEEMATLTDLDMEMTGWFQTPTNYYDDLNYEYIKIVGTETYDGHRCKVMVISDSQGSEEGKMWVSEDYGIPLKIEIVDEEGKSTFEYKDVQVGSVSDDVFELPQDIYITDLRTPKE